MARFNFKDWNLKEFLLGRKELLITMVGYVGAFLVTKDPALSAVVAAGTEMIGSLIDYYIQK